MKPILFRMAVVAASAVFVQLQAFAITSAATKSDGLRLECSLIGASSWADVEFVCRLSNETPDAVPYSIVTRVVGFVPSMIKADGSLVPMTESLRKLIPDFEHGSSKLANGLLQPGGTVFFRFKLLEGFQVDDPTGCILRVAWDPGIDGSGSRRRIDKKLAVELKIPELRAIQSQAKSSADEKKIRP